MRIFDFNFFLSLLFFIGNYQTKGTVFRVGIFGNFSSENRVITWPNYTYVINNLGENVTVEYVTDYEVPAVPDNISSYEKLVADFATYNLSAIIADYNEGLKMATFANNITYYLITNAYLARLSSNMLYLGFDSFVKYKLLKVLLDDIGFNKVVSYKFTDALIDESQLNNIYTWMISILKKDIEALTRQYENVFSKMRDFGATHLVNLMIYNDADAELFDIFEEMVALNGLFREDIIWIAHSLTNVLDPILMKYSEAGSTIMSFSVEKLLNYTAGKLSDKEIRYLLTVDSRNHFEEALKGYSNESLLTYLKEFTYEKGETGVVSFDSNGYRQNVDYVVTKYSKTGYDVIFKIKNLKITSTPKNVLFRDIETVTKFLVYKNSFYYLINSENEKVGFSITLADLFAHNFEVPLKLEYVEIPSEDKNVIRNAIQNIIDEKADVCLIPIPQDRDFDEFKDKVAYTSPIFKNGFSLLRSDQDTKEFWPSWIFIPFTLGVWISIVATLILAIFVNFIVGVITYDYSNYLNAGKLLHDSFFFAFTSLLKAQMPLELRSITTRTFALFYWLVALIIVMSYGSNLVAYLANSKEALPFASLDDLGALDRKIHNYSWFYMLGDQPFYDPLYAFDEPTSVNTTRVYAKNAVQAVEWMKNDPNRLLIQTYAKNIFIRSQDCNYKIVGSERDVYNYVLVMRKSWTLKDNFIKFIQNQISSGGMAIIYHSWFYPETCRAVDTNRKPTFTFMSLEKLSGLFIIVGGSVVIAFILILLQFIGRSMINCVRNKRIPKLQFGHEYEAYVDSIEANGIYVVINKRPRKYFMYNAYLHTDPLKIYNAHDLNIRARDKIHVRYFGKDPLSRVKRFVRVDETEC